MKWGEFMGFGFGKGDSGFEWILIILVICLFCFPFGGLFGLGENK